VQMLHGEGVAHQAAGAGLDSLPPKAGISISWGAKVQRLAVRRPVGPVVTPSLRDRDPGAFGNRLRPIDGRDRDAPAIRLNPNLKLTQRLSGENRPYSKLKVGCFSSGTCSCEAKSRTLI
jgi:hypothetical protein